MLLDAADLDALRLLVAHRRIDVVVCGHRTPVPDARFALDACRRITMAIPVVVLARGGDEDTAVALMTAGASDYLPMPCRGEEMRRALDEAMSTPVQTPRSSPTARFAHLLDQLDIGAFRILPNRTIVEASDATRRIMRFPSMAALSSRAGSPSPRPNASGARNEPASWRPKASSDAGGLSSNAPMGRPSSSRAMRVRSTTSVAASWGPRGTCTA